MTEYACENCKRIVTKKECPVCGSKKVSDKWKGVLVIFDSKKSKFAEESNIDFPGKYAIEVK